MPDLEAFEAEVKKNIKLLSSKDTRTRRKAAAWLGEAGDPTAITALVQVYKNDRDPQVRDTARYSLGMFRALQEAWDDDQERVGQLLEDVALNGRIGRRAPVPVRRIAKLEIGLLLAALLLAAAAYFLPRLLNPDAVPGSQPTGRDRAAIMADLRAGQQQISGYTETLRQEYQKVLTGQSLTCNRDLTVGEFRLSDGERRDFPDAADLADRLNQTRQDFSRSKAAYDSLCQQNTPLAAADVGPLLAELGAISQALALMDEPEAAATAPAAPTDAPADAGADAAPVNVREHVVALQQIIDNLTGFRGANTLLIRYWTEVQTAGSTQGCREAVPTIPADYALPAAIAESSPDLELAAGLVNTGLKGVRDGWQVFAAACGTNQPALSSVSGLARANAANQAFNQAGSLLSGLRGGA